MAKTCLCGQDFEPNDPRQRSCSTKCAHKFKPKHHKKDCLKKNYGMTLEEWDRMFLEQKGCCKLCGTHQSQLKKALYVDHNHTTGAVRGLLCPNCNFALGLFRDDPVVLQRAKEYVS